MRLASRSPRCRWTRAACSNCAGRQLLPGRVERRARVRRSETVKVSGTSVLHAPPQQVWDAINDPYVLATVVPGCEGLTAITPGHFRLDVSLGVASIKGSYRGDVQFTDLDEPRSLIMHAAGAGSAGTINTTVRVNL